MPTYLAPQRHADQRRFVVSAVPAVLTTLAVCVGVAWAMLRPGHERSCLYQIVTWKSPDPHMFGLQMWQPLVLLACFALLPVLNVWIFLATLPALAYLVVATQGMSSAGSSLHPAWVAIATVAGLARLRPRWQLFVAPLPVVLTVVIALSVPSTLYAVRLGSFEDMPNLLRPDFYELDEHEQALMNARLLLPEGGSLCLGDVRIVGMLVEFCRPVVPLSIEGTTRWTVANFLEKRDKGRLARGEYAAIVIDTEHQYEWEDQTPLIEPLEASPQYDEVNVGSGIRLFSSKHAHRLAQPRNPSIVFP